MKLLQELHETNTGTTTGTTWNYYRNYMELLQELLQELHETTTGTTWIYYRNYMDLLQELQQELQKELHGTTKGTTRNYYMELHASLSPPFPPGPRGRRPPCRRPGAWARCRSGGPSPGPRRSAAPPDAHGASGAHTGPPHLTTHTIINDSDTHPMST